MKLITDSVYIYLYGFALSPQFTKAKDLCDHFTQIQINLKIADLNRGDFSNMIITRHINQVTAESLDHYAPVTLIGSSLGGLISAHLVQQNPQVQSLVLHLWVFISIGCPSWDQKKPKVPSKNNIYMVYQYAEG